MAKNKKQAIQKIVEGATKSYNPEYGCYVADGQDPKEALRKAQKHQSYKYGETLAVPMGKH